ncbi:hypothetical protein GEOBRER4_n2794 [Citrifermentans bremense]|uniref:Uncharacterized protein n=1 Tax=Citrifermentans bremense TaxID=60035 RepID=A0A6S6M8W2_9BACT|nr:hypothetical protein [Citrifermentans bremense]BCG47941.1 hypothetical protein GEOBRER4_n2794 [Citrifermentans bremense]
MSVPVVKETCPQVGVFFVVQGRVILDTVSVAQGEPYGEAIEHGGHHDFHEQLTPSTPNERIFKVRPYDYFPRGRVVYFPVPNTFRLYADRCLGPDTLRQVAELFHLAGQNVEHAFDEHYQCARCNRNYLL